MGFSAGAGGLLVTYGYGESDTERSWKWDAHFFDVATQAWRALPAPQASSRIGHGQAVLNSTAFVFGGSIGGTCRNDLLSLELGDAAAHLAVVAAQCDVPAARAGGALTAVGQQLLRES